MNNAAPRVIRRGSRRRARPRTPSLKGNLRAVKSAPTMAAPAQGRVVGGLAEAEVAGMTARGRDPARFTRRAGKISGGQATAEAGARGLVREEEGLDGAAQAAEGTGMKGQVCVVGCMQCAVACVRDFGGCVLCWGRSRRAQHPTPISFDARGSERSTSCGAPRGSAWRERVWRRAEESDLVIG